MMQKILIVEDQFIEANSLRLLLTRQGHEITGVADHVERAIELIARKRPDIVLIDIYLKGGKTGIDLALHLQRMSIPFIYISANSNEEVFNAAKATRPDGFLVKPFRKKDLLVSLDIATYRYANTLAEESRAETAFRSQVEILFAGNHSVSRMVDELVPALQSLIPFDYFSMDNEARLRIGFNEYQVIDAAAFANIMHLTAKDIGRMNDAAMPVFSPVFFNESTLAAGYPHSPKSRHVVEEFGIASILFFPVMCAGKIIVFEFFSRRPGCYGEQHVQLLEKMRETLSRIALRISRPGQHLPETPKKNPSPVTPDRRGFDGVVGNNHLLLAVLDQVSQVAPVDTSVLITGESGTGKERIADSIHRLSPRASGPLIKVNCAALPASLIESELFGHEKGSFTGAMDKRIGKFEQANGGTIFLDEIGEMPVELQVKLLRVLQEREIERIGSQSPLKIDVRIIAATNRKLEKEVAEGRFRLDLYYRLNVFPIVLPALRERKDDIPELASHFIERYNRKCGRNIAGIAQKAM